MIQQNILAKAQTSHNEVVEKVKISANKAKKLTQKQKTVV